MHTEGVMEYSNRQTQASTQKHSLLFATIVCLLGAMFYLYEFVLQVSPSVMTTELMRDLNLNAASLGAMAAFYYYAYTPMQLPAGLLYDRFGPRILITAAILICASGAFFFGLTNSVALASAGRFFMGIGSAFSFIGALLLVSRWFPAHYFALLAGIVQLMSSVGAICGQVPLAAAVAKWGWRTDIRWLAFIGLILAIVVWLVVRDYPPNAVQQQKDPSVAPAKQNELSRLRKVCGNKQTWLIALYSFAIWAPIAAFAALWGVPFLVAAYGISTAAAAALCSFIWMGIGIGSPLIGWWSERMGRRLLPLTTAAVIGVGSLLAILYIPHLPMGILYILMFLFGLAAAGQSLAFAIVKDNNDADVTGTAIGLNNMAVVAGGAIFQPLIGIILHAHWNGVSHAGAPVYSTADYRIALLVLPICFLGAAIISFKSLRETFCQHYTVHKRRN